MINILFSSSAKQPFSSANYQILTIKRKIALATSLMTHKHRKGLRINEEIFDIFPVFRHKYLIVGYLRH